MIRQPIDTAPRDGRPVLVFGTWGWESLEPSSHDEAPAWRVAIWEPELSWDWETCEAIGGWKSITSNPYRDYGIATAWAELPGDA